MIEGLNLIANNRCLQVFTFLIKQYVDTLHNKKYTVAELHRELNLPQSTLYKDVGYLERIPDLFRLEYGKKGALIQLNPGGKLVKCLLMIELFGEYGLPIEALDEFLLSKFKQLRESIPAESSS